MGREIEDDNNVVFAEFLEFNREVVLIVIEDEYTIYILLSDVYRFVEIPNLI